jgi:hypothetical protein
MVHSKHCPKSFSLRPALCFRKNRTVWAGYKCRVQILTVNGKGKGKAIPLQALTDPESSRCLKLPDFKTIGT